VTEVYEWKRTKSKSTICVWFEGEKKCFVFFGTTGEGSVGGLKGVRKVLGVSLLLKTQKLIYRGRRKIPN